MLQFFVLKCDEFLNFMSCINILDPFDNLFLNDSQCFSIKSLFISKD